MTEPISDFYRDFPFDDILKCVHCGLCLDACPTYRALGVEQDSPRGRLYLMRAMWEGELAPDAAVAEPLNRCLDCRACETACPSGVPYGSLLEKTRAAMRREVKPNFWQRSLRDWPLRHLVAADRRLLLMSKATRLADRLGLLRAKWLRGLMPGFVRRALDVMPQFDGVSFKHQNADRIFAPLVIRNPLQRVALFTGCVMDTAETEVHKATLMLLRAAGYEVVVPRAQTCCGALTVHAGIRDKPRQWALRNAAAFADKALHAVIVNSAGCGAQLKEYSALFEDRDAPGCDLDWHAFEDKIRDVTAFLAESELVNCNEWRREPVTALVDHPCHLMHAQRDHQGVVSLLSRLPGVTLIEPSQAGYCCGAAGIFNLQQGEVADQVLAAKLDDLERSLKSQGGRAVLLTGNPGCLFQLRHGAAQRGLPLEVQHPAVFLATRLFAP
ncbi:(Fe-S)-binding protein [Acanthopleuribacter pedis]|uniref:Glycolate oxidase iron-sulfur subunit n=1 Tax=Acanthopleuribacter pedis TaxID=442870 RepID=A0A8J7Q9Q6_9BACT|nr:(Fe-S)-binding protein [Acanthopleuribacter pedis]MBO1319564.1 (Fe-S)-binding protein [Acanthopleuribacter pedis]